MNENSASSPRPTTTILRGSPFALPLLLVVQHGSCASFWRSVARSTSSTEPGGYVSKIDLLDRIGGTANRQREPEQELLAAGFEPDRKQFQAAFAVSKNKSCRRLLLRNDGRHRSLRHHGLDRYVGAASPPGAKELFYLRFRKVFRIGDDRKKLQQRLAGVVHAEPD